MVNVIYHSVLDVLECWLKHYFLLSRGFIRFSKKAENKNSSIGVLLSLYITIIFIHNTYNTSNTKLTLFLTTYRVNLEKV